MPTKRRTRSKRRRSTKKRGGNLPSVGGLKHHLKHLDHNKALVNTLKSASKGHLSAPALKKAQTGLKRLAVHANQAASAAGKGVTKINQMGGKKHRRSRKRRGSRKRRRSKKRR